MKKGLIALIAGAGGFMAVLASKICPKCGGHKKPGFLVCRHCARKGYEY